MSWWFATYVRALFITLGAVVGSFCAGVAYLALVVFGVAPPPPEYAPESANVFFLMVDCGAAVLILLGACRGLGMANRYLRFRA